MHAIHSGFGVLLVIAFAVAFLFAITDGSKS